MPIRVEIVLTYEANPEHYDPNDPSGIAAQDQASFEDGSLDLISLFDVAKEIQSVEFCPE